MPLRSDLPTLRSPMTRRSLQNVDETFLSEISVSCQYFMRFLVPHHSHTDTVDHAVPFVGSGDVEPQRGEILLASDANDPVLRV